MDAVMIGIIFARISYPKYRGRTIAISDSAIISRRDGVLKFMFRIADFRRTQVLVYPHTSVLAPESKHPGAGQHGPKHGCSHDWHYFRSHRSSQAPQAHHCHLRFSHHLAVFASLTSGRLRCYSILTPRWLLRGMIIRVQTMAGNHDWHHLCACHSSQVPWRH